MMIGYMKLFLLSFFITLLVTPIFRKIAFRVGALDHPNQRKLHTSPIPLLGGVSIYLAFLIAVLSTSDYSEPLKGVLIGGTIIFAIGLIDDLNHLSAALKLVGQILASLILIKYGIIIKAIPNFYLSAFVTVFGVVGITNALNFLDNMDGLASGLASISAFSFFLIAFQTGQKDLGFLTIALVGSTLSFLIYNFKPAKIFMGDTGSTFLGFTLAALAIMGEWSSYIPVAITVPVLILGILIFDTTLITVLRIKDGKVRNLRQWIEHADTDHFSHRLVGLGLSQRQAVLFMYGVNLSLGMVAVILQRTGGIPLAIIVVGSLLIIAFLGGKKLDKAEL